MIRELLDSPPNNKDAEADTLGCVLLKPELFPAVLEVGLTASDFHDPVHREIFSAMLSLRAAGKPPEPKLVLPWLQSHATVEHAAALIVELTRRQAIGNSAVHYADLVLDVGKRRELHHLSEAMLLGSNNGKSVDAILGESREQFEKIAGRGKQAGPQPISLGQLMDENPKLHETTIDGLLRRGETLNLISQSKVGKSWLSNHAGMCFATGSQFLSSFQCRSGRVLLIDNELHKATIAFRNRSVAEAMAIQPADFRLEIEVISLRGQRMDLYGIARLLEQFKAGDFVAVILDAWYRALPKGVDENSNRDITEMYDLIDSVTGRLNCCWLNVHHSSKGSQSEKSVTDVGSGAGAQSRAADTHLILRQHEDDDAVVLDGKLRTFPPIEPLALRWNFPLWTPADDLDPAKLKGKLTAGEQRQSGKDNEAIAKLATALAEGDATIRVLRGRTGLSKERCERLLDVLEANGSINWIEVRVRGNVCRQYHAVNLDEINDTKEPF